MKTNFNIKKDESTENIEQEKTDLSESEFEDFMSKTGASGSFMIFRSKKKENELGLDEL